MGETQDASPRDSSHTDPSPQVDPNVESTPDSLLLILHSLAQLTLRGIYLTMKGMLPSDGPLAVTKGCHHCDTGINNVMIRHFEVSLFCTSASYCCAFVCAPICLTSFNLKQQGWNGVIMTCHCSRRDSWLGVHRHCFNLNHGICSSAVV